MEEGMRILAIGANKPGATDNHRVAAMRRLGHEVDTIGPDELLRRGFVIDRIRHRTGYRSVGAVVQRRLRHRLHRRHWDVIWVGGGREIGPRAAALLQQHASAVVSFNHDDPWGPRDGRLWDTYRKSLPEFDLVIVRRDENVPEALRDGAKRVLRIWLPYDEQVHVARTTSNPRPLDVAFVGSWEPDRGPLLKHLLRAGLDVTFWGNGWDRAPEWKELKPHFGGNYLADRAYTEVLERSKVALGLLSKGNRDLHTNRSVEIPMAGALLCAERTTEHELLLGDAALLWSTPEECVQACLWALENPAQREALAERGRQRVAGLGMTNERFVADVLDLIVGKKAFDVWPEALDPTRTAGSEG
jgi:hypothetical protein